MRAPRLSVPQPSWKALRSVGQGLLAAGEFPDQAALALLFGPEVAGANSPIEGFRALNPMMAMGGARLGPSDPVVSHMRQFGRYDLDMREPWMSGVPVPRPPGFQHTREGIPYANLNQPPALRDVNEPGVTAVVRARRLLSERLKQEAQRGTLEDEQALANFLNDAMRPGFLRVESRRDANLLRRKERADQQHLNYLWKLKRADLKELPGSYARQMRVEGLGRDLRVPGKRGVNQPQRPELNAAAPIGAPYGGARKRVTKRTGIPDAQMAFRHRG